MRKMLTIVTALAVLGLTSAWAPKQADARPDYQKAFLAKYDKLSDADKDMKCLMCHGKDKKQRSDYAKALEKALGAKNVKDVDKINAALTEAEAKEYEDGKTYGSLLNAGKLPAPYAE